MGGVFSKPEVNERGLYILVAGLSESSACKSGFADLSRADNHYRWELIGKFP